MIKNVDLLYTVSKALKDKFGYKISLKQKEDVESPIFFVKVTPLTTTSMLKWNEKLVNITITFTDEVVTHEQLLNIQDDLNDLFDVYLDTGARKLVIDKKTFNLTDDFLTLTLTITYLDDKAACNIPLNERYTDLMKEFIDNM
ncbi:MAG: DUF6838 family protein [Solirubrobacterales bacterium]